MPTNQRSFLLLPDASFSLGKNIQLGRLLMQTRGARKFPDPRRPLSAPRIDVTPEALERPQKFKEWQWSSNDALKTDAGVWADISLLTGVGAGLDVDRSRGDALQISGEGVVQQTFYVTDEDIETIVKHETISRLLSGLDRPSVFLITGLMTAEKARFEIVHGREHGIDAHASADLTSTGAPLDVGLKGAVRKSTRTTLISEPQESFVLAYQLHRIRKKLLGGYEGSIERRAALFDDVIPVSEAESLHDFEVEMLAPLTPTTTASGA